MTLRNSFLTNLKENIKRRVWPMALYSLLLLFLYPVRIAIILSNEIEWEATKLNLQKDAFTYLGFDATTMVVVAICAVLSALQGFSWLYQKKRVDMYMSQPVSAKKIFATNYLGGLFAFFIPFIVTQWLSVMIVFIMGAGSTVMQINNLFSFLICFLFFFVVYNITILAMMLCGHMSVAGLAAGVFLFYDFVVYGIVAVYFESYFRTFSYNYTEFYKYILSPLYKAGEMIGYTKNIWDKRDFTLQYAWETTMQPMGKGMLWFLVQGTIALGIALWCFLHRPMENSDKAIAFPKIKQPVKVVMIATAGLGMSVCLYSFSEGKDGFALLGLVSGILIGQFIMEIIYDFDIKSFMKGKIGLAIGAVAAVAVYASFSLDLFGYDSYIPDAEDVESAAISINFYTDIHNRIIEEDFEVTWVWNEPIEEMEITNVSPILQLAQHGMGKDDGKFEQVDTVWAELCYHMKNGRDIYRSIPIDYEADAAILDELFVDEQYKAFSQLSEDLQGFYQICDASYSNGIEKQKVTDKNAAMLMEYYRQDYMDMTFTDVKDTMPYGKITLSYLLNGYPNTVDYPVYPTYERTTAYLESKGVVLQDSIDADAVASIEITNYNYVDDTEYTPEAVIELGNGTAYARKDGRMEKIIYEDKAQIEEILNAAYSSEMLDYRYISDTVVHDLEITINTSDSQNAYIYDWYSIYMEFTKDSVPQFVCEDLNYDPETMD